MKFIYFNLFLNINKFIKIIEKKEGNSVAPLEWEDRDMIDDDFEKEKFANKVEYWLSCIGFAVGFGKATRSEKLEKPKGQRQGQGR